MISIGLAYPTVFSRNTASCTECINKIQVSSTTHLQHRRPGRYHSRDTAGIATVHTSTVIRKRIEIEAVFFCFFFSAFSAWTLGGVHNMIHDQEFLYKDSFLQPLVERRLATRSCVRPDKATKIIKHNVMIDCTGVLQQRLGYMARLNIYEHTHTHMHAQTHVTSIARWILCIPTIQSPKTCRPVFGFSLIDLIATLLHT